MSGILDWLMSAITNSGDETDTKKKIIDPKALLAEQAANGLSADNLDMALKPFLASNPKAEAARKQAEIDKENERLDAEEMERQKKVFLGPSNPRGASHDLNQRFMDNADLLNDHIQSEARFNADAANQPDLLGRKTIAPANQQTQDDATPSLIKRLLLGDAAAADYPGFNKAMQLDTAKYVKPAPIADDPHADRSDKMNGEYPVERSFEETFQSPKMDVNGATTPAPTPAGMESPRFPAPSYEDFINRHIPAAPAAPTDQRTVPNYGPAPVGEMGRENLLAANPANRQPTDQERTASTPPAAGQTQDDGKYAGIYPVINPADKAKYGQFPEAPDPNNPAKPYTASATAQAKPSDGLLHLGGFSFDPSVIGPALAVLDSRNTGLAAGLLDRVDSRRKQSAADALKKENQDALYNYFKGQGMSDADAKMYSQNDEIAAAWYKSKTKSADPANYGTTVQYTGDGKAYVVGNDGSVKYLDVDALTPEQRKEAEARGNARGKGQGQAQFNLPEVAATVDRVDERVAKIVSNPNLGAIVGPLDTMTPDALKSSESVQLRSWIDQIKGENFLTIRQKLKGQGSITDFESGRAESINAIERAMNARDPEVLRQAIMDFQGFVHKWAGIAEQQAGAEPGSAGSTNPPSSGSAPDYKSKYGLD